MHAPVTHPTLQPPLMVSIIFLFISVFLLIFSLLIFSLSLSFSSPTCVCVDNSPTLVHCDARIVFLLCTHTYRFSELLCIFFSSLTSRSHKFQVSQIEARSRHRDELSNRHEESRVYPEGRILISLQLTAPDDARDRQSLADLAA